MEKQTKRFYQFLCYQPTLISYLLFEIVKTEAIKVNNL